MPSKEKANNGVFLISILLLIGFLVGWGGNKYFATKGIAVSESAENVFVLQSKEIEQQKNKTGIADQVESASQNQGILAGSTMVSQAEALLALILNEPNDHQLAASRIIKYLALRLAGGSRSVLKEKALRKLLRETPELNFALIDQYSNIEDMATKMQLGLHLMLNNSSQAPFLEPKLMQKIKLNEDRSEMLKLLGEWGLQAKSSIAYLAKEIPYMEMPQDVGAAIHAISKSSWVNNSALSPADMKHLSDMMSEFRNSDQAEIRAASIAALRVFPNGNYQKLVVDSLDDSSDLVRGEAMMLYANNPFRSVELENKLMDRLQDSSFSYSERSLIASNLSSLAISEEQKQTIQDFQEQLTKYYESLSEQQRKDLP